MPSSFCPDPPTAFLHRAVLASARASVDTADLRSGVSHVNTAEEAPLRCGHPRGQERACDGEAGQRWWWTMSMVVLGDVVFAGEEQWTMSVT